MTLKTTNRSSRRGVEEDIQDHKEISLKFNQMLQRGGRSRRGWLWSPRREVEEDDFEDHEEISLNFSQMSLGKKTTLMRVNSFTC
ncbi:hypothetical protein ACE6H2_020176 [Prunus campanulata]